MLARRQYLLMKVRAEINSKRQQRAKDMKVLHISLYIVKLSIVAGAFFCVTCNNTLICRYPMFKHKPSPLFQSLSLRFNKSAWDAERLAALARLADRTAKHEACFLQSFFLFIYLFHFIYTLEFYIITDGSIRRVGRRKLFFPKLPCRWKAARPTTPNTERWL